MEVPMKVSFTPTLRVVTALSAMVLIGVGVELPLRQACGAQPQVSFSEDILPLLKWRCASCHQPGGAGYEKSPLDLTSYAGLMKGTGFAAMIVPGNPEASNLMRLVDWRVP